MDTNRFSRSAIERISENRVLHAMEQGDFDNLPGFGKPLPGIDEPYDPNWWVRQWMRREDMSRALAEGLRRMNGK